MTSKSCFLQHKSSFENAELAGKGSSILPSKWLNFAGNFFFFFLIRFTFQLQKSSVEKQMKIQRTLFPQSHYPILLSVLALSKNFNLFFPELGTVASWPARVASWITGRPLLLWVPLPKWQRPHACGPVRWKAQEVLITKMVQGVGGGEDSIFLSWRSEILPCGDTSGTAAVLPPIASEWPAPIDSLKVEQSTGKQEVLRWEMR